MKEGPKTVIKIKDSFHGAFLRISVSGVHYRRLTEFGPPMWQAEADTELTLFASPATAVGQILLEYGMCTKNCHMFKSQSFSNFNT